MKMRILAFLVVFCLLFGAIGCSRPVPEEPAAPVPSPSTAAPPPPEEKERLQGVWVSFLDLDSRLEGCTPAEAARALDSLLDTAAAYHLNTVFFHVRSHGNAYYPSAVYPAADSVSALLRQGFDPLAYAVEAAHSRHMALHAWVNPYRLGKTKPADSRHGFAKGGQWYADPASAEARRRVLDGIREILDGYAVDGIHFDDYFYPAGMAPEGEAFEHIPEGMTVTDWRQTQVDTLVAAVHGLCRSRDRLFGISPGGHIGRCRTEAFAAVDRWAEQPGYVDYLCPQIYTGFQHSTRPFDRVLEEWTALKRHEGCRLYIGLALYKAGLPEDTYAGEGRWEWRDSRDILARQVRCLTPIADGLVLFRCDHLFGKTQPLQQELEALRPLL